MDEVRKLPERQALESEKESKKPLLG